MAVWFTCMGQVNRHRIVQGPQWQYNIKTNCFPTYVLTVAAFVNRVGGGLNPEWVWGWLGGEPEWESLASSNLIRHHQAYLHMHLPSGWSLISNNVITYLSGTIQFATRNEWIILSTLCSVGWSTSTGNRKNWCNTLPCHLGHCHSHTVGCRDDEWTAGCWSHPDRHKSEYQQVGWLERPAWIAPNWQQSIIWESNASSDTRKTHMSRMQSQRCGHPIDGHPHMQMKTEGGHRPEGSQLQGDSAPLCCFEGAMIQSWVHVFL